VLKSLARTCPDSHRNCWRNTASSSALPEQQRIAAILERADRLRRLRRYALELSEGYLQAVFVEMFGIRCRIRRGGIGPQSKTCP